MFGPFVAEFSFLLDSSKDGIEVSYNAAGVLSHLASDGPEGWSIQEPSREHVLERLVRAVSRWDVQARRDINYRSLPPHSRVPAVGGLGPGQPDPVGGGQVLPPGGQG